MNEPMSLNSLRESVGTLCYADGSRHTARVDADVNHPRGSSNHVGGLRALSGGAELYVDCDERAIWPPDWASRLLQPLERLWRRDLVHQVAVDVQERSAVRRAVHHVVVPNFVVHCAWAR